MPKLYDCFTFFNELDLLEIRLHELSPVVDRFVLAEAPVTFRGKPKPLHFQENRARFAPFLDRITHIVVDAGQMPTGERPGDDWAREYAQRNRLADGVREAAPDDLVLLSDVDEIPRSEILQAAKRSPPAAHEVICLELRMFYYFLNLESPQHWERNGPRCLRRSNLPQTMQAIRNVKGVDTTRLGNLRRAAVNWRNFGHPVRRRAVRNAGWHFTYLGAPAAIQEKLGAIAGTGKTPDDFWDVKRLAERIRRKVGVANDEVPLTFVPIDETFPRRLQNDIGPYRHLVGALDSGFASGTDT
jgi:beta-1,4-mannosyl-glycoprotein beta-1,4-N-acetylglucosaminyltransferase